MSWGSRDEGQVLPMVLLGREQQPGISVGEQGEPIHSHSTKACRLHCVCVCMHIVKANPLNARVSTPAWMGITGLAFAIISLGCRGWLLRCILTFKAIRIQLRMTHGENHCQFALVLMANVIFFFPRFHPSHPCLSCVILGSGRSKVRSTYFSASVVSMAVSLTPVPHCHCVGGYIMAKEVSTEFQS